MSILLFFIVGVVIGCLFRKQTRLIQGINRGSYVLLGLLIFIMGTSMGNQHDILENFSNLGVNSFFLALGGIIGSILFILPIMQRGQENQK